MYLVAIYIEAFLMMLDIVLFGHISLTITQKLDFYA